MRERIVERTHTREAKSKKTPARGFKREEYTSKKSTKWRECLQCRKNPKWRKNLQEESKVEDTLTGGTHSGGNSLWRSPKWRKNLPEKPTVERIPAGRAQIGANTCRRSLKWRKYLPEARSK